MEEKRRFTEHISGLQLRQRELAQQIADELVAWERELDKEVEERIAEARQPLVDELHRLQELIQQLERERQDQTARLLQLQGAALGFSSQLQETLTSFGTTVEQSAESFRQTVGTVSLQSIEAVSLPTPTRPATPPPPARLQEASLPPASNAKEKKEKKRRSPRPLLRLARRGGLLAAAVAALYFGWGFLQQSSAASKMASLSTAGQVAGVSTDPSITKSAPSQAKTTDQGGGEYAESQADVPYADTQWETSNDRDFGVSMLYPHNTTNRIHLPGSSNLWFLRKNGYLMKLTKNESTDQLDAWWQNNNSDYQIDYILSKGSFKNQPAWIAHPKASDETSGTYYFVKHGNAIYQIWVKDEPPTTDDGQRIAKMISSLQFLD